MIYFFIIFLYTILKQKIYTEMLRNNIFLIHQMNNTNKNLIYLTRFMLIGQIQFKIMFVCMSVCIINSYIFYSYYIINTRNILIYIYILLFIITIIYYILCRLKLQKNLTMIHTIVCRNMYNVCSITKQYISYNLKNK